MSKETILFGGGMATIFALILAFILYDLKKGGEPQIEEVCIRGVMYIKYEHAITPMITRGQASAPYFLPEVCK